MFGKSMFGKLFACLFPCLQSNEEEEEEIEMTRRTTMSSARIGSPVTAPLGREKFQEGVWTRMSRINATPGLDDIDKVDRLALEMDDAGDDMVAGL